MSHPITKLAGVALATWLFGKAAAEFSAANAYNHEIRRADAQATTEAQRTPTRVPLDPAGRTL